MSKFSFITPIAYDYKYAVDAIRSYYDLADEIILGIDENRISWSGSKYDFDDKWFGEEITKFNTGNKIKMVLGNFHASSAPIINDTHERNALTTVCKEGNYIFQIDSDEILLNLIEFKEWLKTADLTKDIRANWITVFKSFGDKVLSIDGFGETDGIIPIGTPLKGNLTSCRETGLPHIVSPLRLLHYSWGRTREELKQKMENWGHSGDFNTNAYLELWDQINLDNYKDFKNLHPLHGPHWPSLKVLNTKEIK